MEPTKQIISRHVFTKYNQLWIGMGLYSKVFESMGDRERNQSFLKKYINIGTMEKTVMKKTSKKPA